MEKELMKKASFVLVVLVTIIGLLSFVLVHHAALATSGTLHFGPIASTTPDSGTCGNNWATDTFNRFFTINLTEPNTVIEDFKDGTFVTFAGSSPGACENGPNNGTTVGAGVAGKFQGSFDIAVTGGSFNPNAVCTPTTCNTTAGFIQTVYGASATYVTGATYFLFNYSADSNGHWKNASANRGGNLGDITGTP
jgi:hypothetical protein